MLARVCKADSHGVSGTQVTSCPVSEGADVYPFINNKGEGTPQRSQGGMHTRPSDVGIAD